MEPEPFPEFLAYEWFDGFTRINTFEQMAETILESPPKPEPVDIIEEQFETALDGIKETADLIAGLSKATPNHPSTDWRRWVKSAIKDPRKYVDHISLMRYLKMNLGIRIHSVPEARRYDFFSAKEILERLEREDPLYSLKFN
jgi:hypothetical protein